MADYAGQKLVIFFYPRADTPGCTREAIDFTRLKDAFARLKAEREIVRAIRRHRTMLAPEAALARTKPSDPRVAERFEIYACGVELANGFGEGLVSSVAASLANARAQPGPTSSLAAFTSRAGVVVLRSPGKFFGLAGLRVGFVVVAKSDAGAWHRSLGDWPVSGPACEIATLALRDKAWISATRTRLSENRKHLDHTLGQAGFRMLGGTDLFGLFEAPDESDWLDHFARMGILVRAFATASRHYRIGLPADDAAWQRLELACRAASSPARRPNTAQSVTPRPAR